MFKFLMENMKVLLHIAFRTTAFRTKIQHTAVRGEVCTETMETAYMHGAAVGARNRGRGGREKWERGAHWRGRWLG
jgi:hypothetical protein